MYSSLAFLYQGKSGASILLGTGWRCFGASSKSRFSSFITFTITPSETEAVRLTSHYHDRHVQVDLLYILYPRVSHHGWSSPTSFLLLVRTATVDAARRHGAHLQSFTLFFFHVQTSAYMACHTPWLFCEGLERYTGAGSSFDICVLERKSFDKI